jgi:flagellar biosynthesis chaperone FliJ
MIDKDNLDFRNFMFARGYDFDTIAKIVADLTKYRGTTEHEIYCTCGHYLGNVALDEKESYIDTCENCIEHYYNQESELERKIERLEDKLEEVKKERDEIMEKWEELNERL